MGDLAQKEHGANLLRPIKPLSKQSCCRQLELGERCKCVLCCADLHDAGHFARLACGTHSSAVTAKVRTAGVWLSAGNGMCQRSGNKRTRTACGFAGIRDFLGCRDDEGIIVMAAHQQIVCQLQNHTVASWT